jgi:phospholipid/cholesterol/gamma-HCH transport system substrate-binding protein
LNSYDARHAEKMKKVDMETAVGLFIIIGILALGYLSVKLGRLEVIHTGGYTLYADFSNVGGLKPGATVEIAGVEVGTVKNMRLDKDYQALVAFNIDKGVKIQEDAIASIKTKGLIGEQFVQITPGGSETNLPAGGKIRETEAAIDIQGLIAKYVFGKV